MKHGQDSPATDDHILEKKPHRHRTLPRSALAARSLWAAEKFPEGSPERAEALRRHFDEFVSGQPTACRARPVEGDR